MIIGLFVAALSMQVIEIPAPVPAPRGRAFDPASCPRLYTDIRTLTIRFDEGSAEVPEIAKRQLAEVFAPIAGDPMAEVEMTSYFPIGAQGMTDPVVELANARIDAIEAVAAGAGVSADLVGGAVTAAGWDVVDGETKRVPYPEGRIEAVDLTVRIKTACHPRAESARRHNPYD